MYIAVAIRKSVKLAFPGKERERISKLSDWSWDATEYDIQKKLLGMQYKEVLL
jgi:hypothetical protein